MTEPSRLTMPAGLPRLLTPAEAAVALDVDPGTLDVDPGTLARWARSGKIRFTLTPGGTRRYDADDVEAIAQARERS